MRADRTAHLRARHGAGWLAALRTRTYAPRLITAVLTGLAVTVAGCAAPGSADAPGDSTGSRGADRSAGAAGLPGQLADRTFLSSSVTGHDLVTGSTIRLTFTAGQLTASAGCNTLSGAYRIADGTITVANMGGTEMGCDQALMEQDTWLAGLLASGLAADLDGDALTLTGQGVTVHLTDRRVADPDRPLEGTTWILDGIITGAGPSASVSSVPQGITATLRIADGKIHFFDGMNDYDGPTGPGEIAIGPDTVRINGDIAGSTVGCASGGACSVDMSVLTNDFDYRITAGQLTVTGTGRYAGHGLVFVAADASTPPPTTSPAPAEPSPTGAPARTADDSAVGSGPLSPAEPVPGVSPDRGPAISGDAHPGKSLPGGHDSIPPRPTPDSTGTDAPPEAGTPAPDAHPLPGHAFRLIELFTDAGGRDTMFPEARFTITFGRSSATAESSCGTIRYPSVRYYRTEAGPMVDLGEPTGPACSLGSDPAGVPAGQLMVVLDDGRLFLSTGAVGWRFAPDR